MKRGPKPMSRTGQIPGTLVCIDCNQESPESNFHKDKNRPTGRYPECKSCCAKKRKAHYKKNWNSTLESQRKYNRRIRKTVLDHYGHKCDCCGENRYEFLAIDHKNGGGLKHRREVLGGRHKSMANWIIKNGFPDGFRLLCHNCNNALGWYGFCPHKPEDVRVKLDTNGLYQASPDKITIPPKITNPLLVRAKNRQTATTEWLREYLSTGEKMAIDMWNEASSRGFKIVQVKRASFALGVVKASSSSLSRWSLPSQPVSNSATE